MTDAYRGGKLLRQKLVECHEVIDTNGFEIPLEFCSPHFQSKNVFLTSYSIDIGTLVIKKTPLGVWVFFSLLVKQLFAKRKTLP